MNTESRNTYKLLRATAVESYIATYLRCSICSKTLELPLTVPCRANHRICSKCERDSRSSGLCSICKTSFLKSKGQVVFARDNEPEILLDMLQNAPKRELECLQTTPDSRISCFWERRKKRSQEKTEGLMRKVTTKGQEDQEDQMQTIKGRPFQPR